MKCTFETQQAGDILSVWVEPLGWDETNGPCPITQIDVEVTNYLDEQEVRGTRAVAAIESSCSFHPYYRPT